jgi:hypothetical protein
METHAHDLHKAPDLRSDAEVGSLLIHQDVMEGEQKDVWDASNAFVKFGKLQSLSDSNVIEEPLLVTTDKKDLNKYFKVIYLFKSSCLALLRRLHSLNASATSILIFFDKKGYSK